MLKCVIIEQSEGYVTHALNMGKSEASGDLVIFTDDDAIAFPKWVERYIKLHQMYSSNVACISSRDIYIDLNDMRIKPTPDDIPYIKLYRWLVRPWLERPHPIMRKYRLGVYLTVDFKIAHGPYIPTKPCYSLPFRGVNMSFKGVALSDVWFPEHPLLRRALGYEQYIGIQLVMKEWDSIYVPSNPVLHIMHESLSRTKSDEVRKELEIMRTMYAKLINQKL